MEKQTSKQKKKEELKVIGVRINAKLRYDFGIACKVLESSEREVVESLIGRWLDDTEEKVHERLAKSRIKVKGNQGKQP